jgi:GNAT superfamily N-acetyltransferase
MDLAEDIAVHELSVKTFENLAERMSVPPSPPPHVGPALLRIRHLVGTDPGAWIGEHGGRVVGAALAIVARDLGGLSLLVVDPDHQSAGLGRSLLARSLEHGDGDVRGGVILASPDARALRAYARAGFQPHPSFEACGPPRAAQGPDGVREGTDADLALTARGPRGARRRARGRHQCLPGGGRAAAGRAGPRLRRRPRRQRAPAGWHLGAAVGRRARARRRPGAAARRGGLPAGRGRALPAYLPSGAYL